MDPIDAAATRLARAARVTSFTGAGLSAESGIGTFRDDDDGHWRKFDPMVLASQQGFADDRERVMRWYAERRRTLQGAEPNAAHRALAADDRLHHVTQNVDDLLERAGAPGSRVHHLHGTLLTDRCNDDCGYEIAVNLLDAPILHDCPRCSAPMRPSVVWFGEGLDSAVWEAAEHAVAEADVLLVVGTSLMVQPAAGLVQAALQLGATTVYVDPAPDADIVDASARNDRLFVLRGMAGDVVPRLLAR